MAGAGRSFISLTVVLALTAGLLLASPEIPAYADEPAENERSGQYEDPDTAAGDQSDEVERDRGGVLGWLGGLLNRDSEEQRRAGDGTAGPEVGASGVLPSRERAPIGEQLPEARRVRELVEERTAHARLFELTDGRVQAEISADPVHYQDAEGVWREIDTEVEPSDRSGFVASNEANSLASWFGDRSDRLVRVEHEGRSVVLGVAGGARPLEPQAEGDVVTYPGVFADADLRYQVAAGAVKEQIILDAAPASGDAVFTFTVDLEGLEARKRGDGSIAFFAEEGDGPPPVVMPRPFMVDSGDDPSSALGYAHSDEVSQTLGHQDGQLTVTVTADGDWLRDADRVYPVVIDPTVEVAPPPAESRT